MLRKPASRMLALQACAPIDLGYFDSCRNLGEHAGSESSGFRLSHAQHASPSQARRWRLLCHISPGRHVAGELIERLKHERDAILQQALAAKRPLTWPEQEELFRWYSARVDAYLDASHGECLLKRRDLAELVANALRYFEGQRYELCSWVVMPNHVHAVVWPKPPQTLTKILHSWKSFTANAANKILKRTNRHFWQAESYDHLVRDDADMARCCEYTTRNPVSARLCERPEDWEWSSACQAHDFTQQDACAT